MGSLGQAGRAAGQLLSRLDKTQGHTVKGAGPPGRARSPARRPPRTPANEAETRAHGPATTEGGTRARERAPREGAVTTPRPRRPTRAPKGDPETAQGPGGGDGGSQRPRGDRGLPASRWGQGAPSVPGGGQGAPSVRGRQVAPSVLILPLCISWSSTCVPETRMTHMSCI